MERIPEDRTMSRAARLLPWGVLLACVLLVALEIHLSSGRSSCRPITKIECDLRHIVCSATIIWSMTGVYPESIASMVNAVDAEGRELPALERLPLDPWGNEYGYELRDGRPVAWCLGGDGKPGGTGEDRDTVYPE
jgi:hypothetical protein